MTGSNYIVDSTNGLFSRRPATPGVLKRAGFACASHPNLDGYGVARASREVLSSHAAYGRVPRSPRAKKEPTPKNWDQKKIPILLPDRFAAPPKVKPRSVVSFLFSLCLSAYMSLISIQGWDDNSPMGLVLPRWQNKVKAFEKWIDSQEYEFSPLFGWFESELEEYEAFDDYDSEVEDGDIRDDLTEYED